MKHEKYLDLKNKTVSKPSFVEKCLDDSYCFAYSKLISHDVDEKIYDSTEKGIFDTSNLKPTLHRLVNEKI